MVKGRPKGSNTTSLVKVPQVSQWAQCDNQGCAKWRRLPPGSAVDDSVPWFCFMNPDELRNSCEAPEESYNEDVEDYQTLEEPSIQISSDDDGATAHGSWRGGSAQRGAKRKHGGGGRGRGGAAAKQTFVKPEPQYWAPAPAPGAKRQRTFRLPEDSERMLYGAREPDSARLQSEASLPGLAQKLPRGAAKVLKAHGAFQKLLAGACCWEAARGRSPAAQVPQHAWEGMAQFAPEAAELACHSLDIASAQSYFAKPGSPHKELQSGSAQRTARLALTMAAAAAADSAAGTFHASMSPSPLAPLYPPRAQTHSAAGGFAVQQPGPLPLHTGAGLSTPQTPALPASAAVALPMPAVPGSGTPGMLAGPAGLYNGSLGASASQTIQHTGMAAPAAALGQAPGQFSMSSSGHTTGSGQHSVPGQRQGPFTGGGSAAASPGVMSAAPESQLDRGQQPAAAHLGPVETKRTGGAAAAPLPGSSTEPRVLAGNPGHVQSLPSADNGSPGLQSNPGLPGAPQYALPGRFEHSAGAGLGQSAGREAQHDPQSSQKPQSAQGLVHGYSHTQKSVKGGDGLLDVQADSSAKAQANSHGAVNGHHHVSSVPNGAFRQSAVRGSASEEHEYARSDHGHGSAEGRPPEVEAAYS